MGKDRVSPLLDYDSDEIALIEGVHQCTEDQIRWRRYKIAEIEQLRRMGETRILFQQEFPENDQTCFLTFGDMVYDADILNEKVKTVFPAPYHYHSADIWYQPEAERAYLVAVDPGVGKQSMTAITVWTFYFEGDHEVAKHCATIWGNFGAEKANEYARAIGKYYNWATIATESNIETLAILLKGYPNLYRRKDLQSGRPYLDIGWVTSSKSKPIMVNELMMMLPFMEVHDHRIIREIRNMRFDNHNRVMSTGLDDLHDSTAIAMMCRASKPIRRGFVFNYGRVR